MMDLGNLNSVGKDGNTSILIILLHILEKPTRIRGMARRFVARSLLYD